MEHQKLKEDLIFMFSKMASSNRDIGESIVLDDNDKPHSYTAAFRHHTVGGFDWMMGSMF